MHMGGCIPEQPSQHTYQMSCQVSMSASAQLHDTTVMLLCLTTCDLTSPPQAPLGDLSPYGYELYALAKYLGEARSPTRLDGTACAKVRITSMLCGAAK
jgi:hypothetical protein